jgi:hypothetical protein
MMWSAASARDDQLEPTIDTESVLLAAMHRVARLGTLLDGDRAVHDAATLRAVPDGGVDAGVIAVGTRSHTGLLL